MNAVSPSAAATGSKSSPLADMAPLVARLRDLTSRWSPRLSLAGRESPRAFRERTGFADRGRRRADLVLASQSAVELGHPRTESCSFVLSTRLPNTVHDGAFTRFGPDLAALSHSMRHPVAQIVVLKLRPGPDPDPFRLDTAQYLINRLPGYMVRSVPGRLWVRVASAALQRGLTFDDVAGALMLAYREEFPEVEGVEVMLVTEDEARIRSLRPLAAEAAVLAGQHKKLVLGAGGEIECTDLSCDSCDEKPTCDALRDVVRRRKTR